MASPSPDLSRLSAQLEHAASQVAFYEAMRERLRLDQRNMRLVLPVGGGLALATYGLLHEPLAALGVLGVTVATCGMGVYFVFVRAQEYDFKLADARSTLETVRAALKAATATPPA